MNASRVDDVELEELDPTPEAPEDVLADLLIEALDVDEMLGDRGKHTLLRVELEEQADSVMAALESSPQLILDWLVEMGKLACSNASYAVR